MKALLFIIGLFSTTAFAQQLSSLTNLCTELEESSGLLYLDDRIISINDEDDDVYLYEIEPTTGNVSRSVYVMKSNNVNWESIAFDNQFIYICDIGNDDGLRSTFKIYVIEIADYLNYDIVDPVVIEFEYPNLNTNGLQFNAEASVVLSGKIYVFTKENYNESTQIYSIPIALGSHTATYVGSLQTDASITDATLNENDEILLTGLDANGDLRVTKLADNGGTFTITDQQTLSVPTTYSGQIEGICSLNNAEYLVSSESSSAGNSGLFSLDWGSTAATDLATLTFGMHPNPAEDHVVISTEEATFATVHNVSGALVWQGDLLPGITEIATTQWNSGVYVVTLNGENATNSEKLVVK